MQGYNVLPCGLGGDDYNNINNLNDNFNNNGRVRAIDDAGLFGTLFQMKTYNNPYRFLISLEMSAFHQFVTGGLLSQTK